MRTEKEIHEALHATRRSQGGEDVLRSERLSSNICGSIQALEWVLEGPPVLRPIEEWTEEDGAEET